jgi:hypothetical protein
MITITGGQFQYPDSSPIVGGTVLFELSEDDQELVTEAGGWVCANVPIKFMLDDSGNVPAGSKIWSNAELRSSAYDSKTQQGTYYIVRVFDVNGLPVSGFPVIWIFTNATGDTQDLSAMINQVSSVL